MRLTGQLLDIEQYAGDFVGENGQKIDYSGERLHVLDGREVTKVKVPKIAVGKTGLRVGEDVDLRISCTVQTGARGSYLSVQLVDSAYEGGLKPLQAVKTS